MKIRELIWPKDRINHIARHGVIPAEVEQDCFSRSLVQRARSEGKNPVYYVLGQTDAGRYLFFVIIQFPNNKGYPVMARPMTGKEQHRYKKWKTSPISLRRWKRSLSQSSSGRFVSDA
jgi:uncharacterized DUF497 family protein